ncbi:MAG: hypothetical protein COB84_09635 [Rhodobacteraceae bacterium]|nr:MAG: hypothetical protein COB84_09635 [Paracoccaceae bacterium]
MAPIDDPRDFKAVLADWLTRNDLSAYAAADILPATKAIIGRWLKGAACPAERSHRALMTLFDEGRL